MDSVKADTSSNGVPEVIRFDNKILTHSLRFLMEAAFFHESETKSALVAPQFRWLDDLRLELGTHGSYCYYTKASEVDDREAADLRARDAKLFCWIKDKDIDGIDVISIRTSFRDLAHAPH